MELIQHRLLMVRLQKALIEQQYDAKYNTNKEGSEAKLLLTLDVFLVGVQGFEPWTPWSQTRCATRLRHTPPWLYCNPKIIDS